MIMRKLLLSISCIFALAIGAMGQTTLVDFETVEPLVEPFDIISYEAAAANPSGEGSVGKIVKAGWAFWGGINVYFGGDIVFTGTDDKFSIDFYTEDAGRGDSILFKFQLFNRYGGVETIEVDMYYSDVNDKEVGVWKTLEYALPDGTEGSYNQMVIFFGWDFASDGDTYYFDNVVAPGYTAHEDTEVTFEITDKFNNATDVGLFIDGESAALTKEGNVYSNTTTLTPYTVLTGASIGVYEIVYTHMGNGEEVRDTTSLVVGSPDGTQEVMNLIIVEEPEDGTALAISVGTTPPTIDGAIDDVWGNAKAHTMQERGWWGTPTGLYTSWKVMWDIDNIYLLYVVEDATPYNGNANNYENDCVETFFDMNQSAATPYDADDWQIRTIRGLDSWTGSANVTAEWGGNVTRAQASMADDAGYHIEMAIPWTSLSATFLPIVGTPFNYDASTADVGTGGGARLFRESWTTNDDIAYFNTAMFGTITLSDLTNEGGGTSVQELAVAQVAMYPNPARDLVTFRSETEISTIQILDITGRVVKNTGIMNRQNVTIGLDDLAGGVYLVNINDLNGASSVKKLRIL